MKIRIRKEHYLRSKVKKLTSLSKLKGNFANSNISTQTKTKASKHGRTMPTRFFIP